MPLSLIWGGWPNPKSGTFEERDFRVYQENGELLGIVEYIVFKPGYGKASTPWGSLEIRAISSYGYEIDLDARSIARIAANPLFTRILVTTSEARQELSFKRRPLSDSMFCETPLGRIVVVGHKGPKTPSEHLGGGDQRMTWAEYNRLPKQSRPTSREAEDSFDWDIEIPSCTDGINEILSSLVAIISYRKLEDEVPLHK
jgi:hypothetical protein